MASDMPQGWRLFPLEECMAAIIDYRGKSPTKTSFGIPLITAKVVKGGRILTPNEFIAASDYDAWMRRGMPQRGDVLITTEAPLGEVAQLDGTKVALAQRLIGLRGKVGLLDNGYLRYVLQGEYVQGQLRSRGTGTTVVGIRQSELRQVRLPVPPLEQQQAIAEVLMSLDDKIDLNRRTNETLELMARATFRAWFVDFDPVRSKADGRQPDGLDAAIAVLFPGKFENSPLGPVPQGWLVVPLGNHVEVTKGLSYKGEGLAEAGVSLHNLNSVYEGGGYKHEGIKHYVGEYRPCHVIRAGDVIVTNTEQGHDHLLIGYSAMIPKRYGDLGLFSHHTYRVRPLPESPLTPPFIHHLLLTNRFRSEVIGYTNGTTVNMLPADGLKRPRLVLPPAELIRQFTDFVTPLIDRAEANEEESRTLTVTRDALLPRLLSGEIRVGDSRPLLKETT